MSTVTETNEVRAGVRTNGDPSDEGGPRIRRRVSVLVAIGVLGWSIVEVFSLLSRHTTGPEMYGVFVAVLAVAASVLGLALLGSNRRRPWATIALLLLWGAVALGGVAGSVAHIVGPVQGHGPIDLRPRPPLAPLVFTLLGLAGGAALWFGQRQETRPADELGKE